MILILTALVGLFWALGVGHKALLHIFLGAKYDGGDWW